jgi:hypothetical protein
MFYWKHRWLHADPYEAFEFWLKAKKLNHLPLDLQFDLFAQSDELERLRAMQMPHATVPDDPF